MTVTYIDRYKDLKGMSWKCTCGKDALIHTSHFIEEFVCEHLYFCNGCFWEYDMKPRLLRPWEIVRKQKDIENYRKTVYGD